MFYPPFHHMDEWSFENKRFEVQIGLVNLEKECQVNQEESKKKGLAEQIKLVIRENNLQDTSTQ
jgi:hypothetical protein